MGVFRFFSAGAISLFTILLLIGLLVILIPLLIFGIIGIAFTRLGFSWITALVVVFLMLFGSFINLPVYTIHRDMVRAREPGSNGNAGSSPWRSSPVWDTTISVNLGGGIIPVCIAVYLVYRAIAVSGIFLVPAVSICIIVVAAIVRFSTQPVNSIGIHVPTIIPALSSLVIGILLSGGHGLVAAVIALAGGTLGTLLGGNLLNINRLPDLDISDFVIGGSGTFGAIFLCCLLPALVA